MKLLTPLFQRNDTCGYRSPKEIVVSLMLPALVTVKGPTPAVIVPFKPVVLRPTIAIKPTASWPPKTGVANT